VSKIKAFNSKMLSAFLAVLMALSCFTSAFSACASGNNTEEKSKKMPYSYVCFVTIEHAKAPAFSKDTDYKKEFIRTKRLKLLLKPSFKKIVMRI